MIYDINGNELTKNNDPYLPYLPSFGETLLIKHRAGNSASLFASAYNNGYKAMEGDVRFTSDAVPIMAHDATLGGLTISSSTLAELQAATTVYTLDDWLCDCKKFNILAEIDFTKTYTQAQCGILVEHIKDTGMINRCTIECYSASSAGYLSESSNDLILSILGCSSTSAIDDLSVFEPKCRKIICVIPHENVSKELASYAHSKSYLSRVWSTDTDNVSQANSYLDMGVDFIITDNVKPSDISP